MASTVSISRTICFTLVQLIILNIVNCEFLASHHNATNYESPAEQNRSKRSLFDTMPPILYLRVENPMGSPFELILVKAESHLANQYLPVVTHGFESNPDVMADVGEFIAYHDLTKCSAVVYFEKLKILRGVIGADLFIHDLPFNFDSKGIYRLESVGYPFIMKYEHSFKHIFPTGNVHLPVNEEIQKNSNVRPSTSYQGVKRPSDSDADLISKHQRSKRTLNEENYEAKSNSSRNEINYIRKRRESISQNRYLEILVFITHDIARIFENFFGPNEYIQWMVRYYIVYFNAIHMMFRKLYVFRHSLFINIAKIVIENNLQPFNFIRDDEFRFTGIYGKLPEYLQAHENYYPPDSFDHIFISTTRLTTDPSSTVHGETLHGSNIYVARQNNDFYGAIPISLVEYYYTDYLIAVHEIAKTFNIKISPPDRGRTLKGQCYGIMQKEGPKCDDCLHWMHEDKLQINNFFRDHPNRCFLLNKPRSMHPPGPYVDVSHGRQCACFGYRHNAWQKTQKNIPQCSKPLICYEKKGNDPRIDVPTILPFDGTPCSKHAKVCWGRQCVPLNQ